MENKILEILQSMQDQMSTMQNQMNTIQSDIKSMQSQIDEHTQILRALEHSSQVNKAEQDKISNNIAHIKGDIESIKKDITNVEVITASNWQDIAKLKSVK